MVQKTSIRTIIIKIKEEGTKNLAIVNKNLDKLKKTAKRTSDGLYSLKRAFQFLVASAAIKFFTDASDSLQLLFDRITIFSGGADKAREAFNDLAAAARFTNSSLAGLATVYSRIALATTDIGLSSKEIIGVTVALQQTFRLSGATLAEATASTIQLSQGLSSGAVRGQELRSVLEANAVFAGLLAKEFNVGRGALIKMGEQGLFTSEVVLAMLARNMQSLNKDAQKLSQTYEQTLVKALDTVKQKIFDLDRAIGLKSKVAAVVGELTSNLAATAAALAVFVGTMKLAAVYASGFFVAVTKGVGILGAFKAGLVGIGAFLTSTLLPVLIAVGAAMGIYQVIKNWETLGDRIKLAGTYIAIFFNEMLLGIQKMILAAKQSSILQFFFGEMDLASNLEGISKRTEEIEKLDMAVYNLGNQIEKIAEKKAELNFDVLLSDVAKRFEESMGAKKTSPMKTLSDLSIATAKAQAQYDSLSKSIDSGKIAFKDIKGLLNYDDTRQKLLRLKNVVYDLTSQQLNVAEKAAKDEKITQEQRDKANKAAIGLGKKKEELEKEIANLSMNTSERLAAFFKNMAVSDVTSAIAGGKEGFRKLFTESVSGIASAIDPVVGAALAPLIDMFSQGPEHAREMVRGFVAGVPEVVTAFVESIPVFIEELTNGIPIIIERLAANMDRIAVVLAVNVGRALGAQMPMVAMSLAKEMPRAAAEFIKGLVAGAGQFMSELTGNVGKATGVSSILGFSQGGIVGGSSYYGDKLLARVNSGEMVLNKAQQQALYEDIRRPQHNDLDVYAHIADAIHAAFSQPIVVQIDGREIARVTREQVKQGYAIA